MGKLIQEHKELIKILTISEKYLRGYFVNNYHTEVSVG